MSIRHAATLHQVDQEHGAQGPAGGAQADRCRLHATHGERGAGGRAAGAEGRCAQVQSAVLVSGQKPYHIVHSSPPRLLLFSCAPNNRRSLATRSCWRELGRSSTQAWSRFC